MSQVNKLPSLLKLQKEFKNLMMRNPTSPKLGPMQQKIRELQNKNKKK